MMAETNLQIIGLKVKVLHPELLKQLEEVPALRDQSQINDIMDKIMSMDIVDSTILQPKLLAIGVVVKLYDPYMLGGWKKLLTTGIRDIMSTYFKVCPSSISHSLSTVINYYQIYKAFKDHVDYISSEIEKEYASTEG